MAFLGKDYSNVVPRSMTKKAEADIPTIYPLRGENRRPEKVKKVIIDLTRKKQVQKEKKNDKCKEKGK